MSEYVLVHALTKEIYSESRGREIITTKDPICARKFPNKLNAIECVRFNGLSGYAPVEIGKVGK